ncbi:MAG: alpha/beta fold hydrolase [Mucilaginibacter sp.]|uniref:alpha/beta fold hydrolase n=1 Tax=Mucilaginibacter sp. TaxID=1882438 RepID=UPI0034E3F191
MKKLSILLLPLLFPCLLFAQTEPANYKEAVNQFKDLYAKGDATQIFNMFNATMQTALSLEKTKQVVNQLKAQLGEIQSTDFKSVAASIATYKTVFTNGIFGLNIGLDKTGKISFFSVRPYQEKASYVISSGLAETPIAINTTDATLSGSLILPAKNSIAKVPVVLIIAGSGPTDRNGNQPGLTAASYFKLADALGKAGIATLRYDKRAVGESRTTKAMVDMRFNDFVNDAIALVKMLKNDPRFSKVIVLGHSEGSLIGMLAAEKEKVDGYISVAGAGDVINKIIKAQLKNQSPEQYKISMNRLDSLMKGLPVKADATDPLFGPSVQPYLISWMKYNPQTEIKKLKIPVLIVQGTTDIQVSVADAQNLKKAKPDATLVLVEGMNHVLKQAPADRAKNLETYNNPDLPVDAKLVDAVVSFINQLK